jgi:hypothetical protein
MLHKALSSVFIAMVLMAVVFSFYSFTNTKSNSNSPRYRVQVYKGEDGSFEGLATFKIMPNGSYLDEGMSLSFNPKKGGNYGSSKTVLLSKKDRKIFKSDSVYPVKEGKWVYFDKSGDVDSIISYDNFKGLSLTVDTGYGENKKVIYFVDTIIRPLYQSRKLFYKP